MPAGEQDRYAFTTTQVTVKKEQLPGRGILLPKTNVRNAYKSLFLAKEDAMPLPDQQAQKQP